MDIRKVIVCLTAVGLKEAIDVQKAIENYVTVNTTEASDDEKNEADEEFGRALKNARARIRDISTLSNDRRPSDRRRRA